LRYSALPFGPALYALARTESESSRPIWVTIANAGFATASLYTP